MFSLMYALYSTMYKCIVEILWIRSNKFLFSILIGLNSNPMMKYTVITIIEYKGC